MAKMAEEDRVTGLWMTGQIGTEKGKHPSCSPLPGTAERGEIR